MNLLIKAIKSITSGIREGLSGNSGHLSSKRIIAFSAFVVLSICCLSALYWNFTVPEFMFDGLMFIVLGGMGSTTVERWANRTTKSTVTTPKSTTVTIDKPKPEEAKEQEAEPIP